MKRWLIPVSLVLVGAVGSEARATECGDARLAYAHFKAAAQIEQDAHHAGPAHDARSGLEKADHQMKSACVPHKVGISALPLGYISLAPGVGSKSSFEPGQNWQVRLATSAGAANGILFSDPPNLTLPSGLKWETPDNAKGPELYVAVATDAQLTVEEPETGKGTWSIEVKNPPQLLAMTALRACANGKGDGGAKLDKASCQMLVKVDPAPGASSLPEAERASYIGEWQYGWKSGLDVGEVEMAEVTSSPSARLELALPLSAAIPGVSDGKKLLVAFVANQEPKPTGALIKLAQDCGNDDDACQKQRLAVTIWYDRVFGVPFVRARAAGVAKGTATGKVADRLARPMAGQRIMLIEPGRKIVTISDDLGEYRFIDLTAGEATVFPVGKKPTDRPGKEEARKTSVGLSEAKVPILYVTKLFE